MNELLIPLDQLTHLAMRHMHQVILLDFLLLPHLSTTLTSFEMCHCGLQLTNPKWTALIPSTELNHLIHLHSLTSLNIEHTIRDAENEEKKKLIQQQFIWNRWPHMTQTSFQFHPFMH